MKIKGHNLKSATVLEIGKFAILWNLFEREKCDNDCTPYKINELTKRIYIDDEKIRKLAKVLNERRSWFDQDISEYVATGLHPGNARQSNRINTSFMQDFLELRQDNLVNGCLQVIYRIRNNLMHGLKIADQLNEQLELFKAVNDVLESIK